MTASRRYMLDSNIMSDMMKTPQGSAARRFKALLGDDQAAEICTSVIVQCELLFGLRRHTNPRWQQQYERLLESLEVMPFETQTAVHYAHLRTRLENNGTPMSPNGLLIAAHAMATDATLVSADVAFARVPGLRLENWLS